MRVIQSTWDSHRYINPANTQSANQQSQRPTVDLWRYTRYWFVDQPRIVPLNLARQTASAKHKSRSRRQLLLRGDKCGDDEATDRLYGYRQHDSSTTGMKESSPNNGQHTFLPPHCSVFLDVLVMFTVIHFWRSFVAPTCFDSTTSPQKELS